MDNVDKLAEFITDAVRFIHKSRKAASSTEYECSRVGILFLVN